jgi:hypothetical protein
MMPGLTAPENPSPTPTFPPIDQRVESGIALLNSRQAPADWLNRIAVDRLDICRADNCVLGHVYGDFGVGMAALDLDARSVVARGFDTCDEAEIDLLNAEWRARLAVLRAAAKAVA